MMNSLGAWFSVKKDPDQTNLDGISHLSHLDSINDLLKKIQDGSRGFPRDYNQATESNRPSVVLGQPALNHNDLKNVVNKALKINQPTAVDAIEKAVDILMAKEKTRMVQNMLQDLDMMVQKYGVPVSDECKKKLISSLNEFFQSSSGDNPGRLAFAEEKHIEEIKEELKTLLSKKKIIEDRNKGISKNKTRTLNEGISIELSIKNIVATIDSIAKVYQDLKTTAESMVKKRDYDEESLDGFPLYAAGRGKRWYDDFYWSKMEAELYTLLEKNPKGAAALKDFFDRPKNERGHMSFKTIGSSLPMILVQVGQQIKSQDLERFGKTWLERHKDYEDFLSKIKSELKGGEDTGETPQTKAPKNSLIGKQNASVEELINHVLRSINKKDAGEIRNAIARESNKLQALQRELAKRNIKI
jgi:hypothetical protein